MNCPKCGAALTRADICQSCGTPVSYAPVNYYQMTNIKKEADISAGGVIAIIVAVIVTVLSLFAADFILVHVVFSSLQIHDDDLIFDDVSSGIYEQEYENGYKAVYQGESEQFSEKLFSFSNGRIDVDYALTLEDAFRGDAAAALLDGTALPELKNDEEFFVCKFNMKILKQSDDAYFLFPFFPDARLSVTSKNISNLKLNYVNYDALLGDEENVDLWCAYVINKNNVSPCIVWRDEDHDCIFKVNDEVKTSSDCVELGAAIKKQNKPDEQ